ncbi:hypothetical protein CHS0354_042179 [Potamilus streckersoni]|uniref:Uncharacterized protein n=1 Tax=Potamilus streckersoni TaxID=2493646 RepID=A0AAE0TLX4_9BIVA|nr:hypothetical protein CHS0354_042179 [Potamilus streckersoni]
MLAQYDFEILHRPGLRHNRNAMHYHECLADNAGDKRMLKTLETTMTVASTDFTPNLLMLGRKVTAPLDIQFELLPDTYSRHTWVENFSELSSSICKEPEYVTPEEIQRQLI